MFNLLREHTTEDIAIAIFILFTLPFIFYGRIVGDPKIEEFLQQISKNIEKSVTYKYFQWIWKLVPILGVVYVVHSAFIDFGTYRLNVSGFIYYLTNNREYKAWNNSKACIDGLSLDDKCDRKVDLCRKIYSDENPFSEGVFYTDGVTLFEKEIDAAASLPACGVRNYRMRGDNDYWERVKNHKNGAKCQQYLDIYPDGLHVEDARDCIAHAKDEISWDMAQQLNTVIGYDKYLNGSSPLIHSAEARLRRDQLKLDAEDEAAWKIAQQSDAVASYEVYLKGPPPLKHSAEALRRRDRLKADAEDEAAWKIAQESDAFTSYEAYLKRPPPLRHALEARLRRDQLKPEADDDAAWQIAQGKRTVAGFNDYLRGPLPLKWADVAREQAWQAARSANTKAEYDAYLSGPPPLTHEGDARRLRVLLDVQKSCSPHEILTDGKCRMIACLHGEVRVRGSECKPALVVPHTPQPEKHIPRRLPPTCFIDPRDGRTLCE